MNSSSFTPEMRNFRSAKFIPGKFGLVWVAALVMFLGLWFAGKSLVPWAYKVPREARLPLRDWIGTTMDWLMEDAHLGAVSFTDVTRFISDLIVVPYHLVISVISSGLMSGQGSNAVQLWPPVSWLGLTLALTVAGYYAGGRRLAGLIFASLMVIVLFGQWTNAMVTLSSIMIAVPLAVGGGLILGLLAYRHRWAEIGLQPILDLMQTVPVFAYLVPILVMFGFGPTSAVIATIIYALPPMTRVTIVSLKGVPAELLDAGTICGCSDRQMTWKVLVPAAMPGLMVGINQVIMLSLNMVIIASMIGAGGLGFDVLAALRRLDIGAGMEAGFAIVFLAVVLDRLSQAVALKSQQHSGADLIAKSFIARHKVAVLIIGILIVSTILGQFIPALQNYPEQWQLSTGTIWEEVVKWININFFDTLEGMKNLLLLNVMIPFKRFLLGLPWAGVCLLLAVAGWSLGGWRLALVTGVLSYIIAVTGQWPKAMVTVYLCGVSVIFASIIGFFVAIYASSRPRLWAVVEAIIDTVQTLPSFVYLMPAVMLFRVGDFTAMIAVVAYAIAPAIRYTGHGLRQVDPGLIEAGLLSGCNNFQILTKIKLRLALPEIMLGINQVIMLALSMLVITALVGTRDLGQEVYIALTKADSGRGLVAGLAVAFIGIIADRLISASSNKMRLTLGLTR